LTTALRSSNPNLGIATGAFILERDDWPAAISRAEEEGWSSIELTAITESRFRALIAHLSSGRGVLSSFTRVSIHAPSHFDSSPAEALAAIPSSLRGFQFIAHPDVYRGAHSLRELGDRVVFENMDVQKSFGRTVEDLDEIYRSFPAAGFCLDVAHVWTNDPSLELGFDLIEHFRDRLAEVHISGIEEDGTHRLTTGSDLARYEPLLAACSEVPWILETELEPDP
jgi:hypothetical protein